MNRAWGWIAVVMLVIVAAGSVFYAERSGLAFDVCQAGEEVSARDRDSIDGVARAFVSRIRDGETTATIEGMSAAGRRDSTRAAIVQVAEVAAQNPTAELELRRVFNAASSDGRHAVRGEWRVRGVHLGLSSIGGIDGARWRQMAAEQRRKNNVFSSTVLHDVANTVIYRGGFLQLSEADGLAREREMYRRHQDLVNGRLELAGEVFSIAAINAMSTETEGVVLVIDLAQAEPVTIAEAIVRNRALIDAMNTHRPEWREVFDGLSVGTPNRSEPGVANVLSA